MRLIQHRYKDDPWMVLVCCILLNRTAGKQVRGVLDEFFRRWPHELNATMADAEEMSDVLRPLGMSTKKAKTIIRFSNDFMYTRWTDPRQLYGIGKYGWEAYQIVCNGRTDITPSDKVLARFIEYVNGESSR